MTRLTRHGMDLEEAERRIDQIIALYPREWAQLEALNRDLYGRKPLLLEDHRRDPPSAAT